MTENERIRELRKAKDMTLEKFGSVLGVKKATISAIENGKNGVTDQMRKAIVREFNVSESWLRDGEGEMFIPRTKNQIITDFAADLINMDDTFKKHLIETLAQLDDAGWEKLEWLANTFTNKKE